MASALSFGVTIVVNRSLATTSLGVSTVLGVRFAIAAVLLLAVLVVKRAPLLPARGERVRVVLLGAVGYMLEATLFFMGLERGTTAAVSLLFYSYPAIVTLLEIAAGWEALVGSNLLALALSAGGVAVVVAAGTDVSITTAGVVFSLLGAACFAVYLLASDRLVRSTDSLTTGAWVAAGASASFLMRGALTGTLRAPGPHLGALVLDGVATASAFVLLFAALRQLGPTRTSVVMTLEALFAIVLAAVFLGEGMRPLQLAGGAAILAATVLMARATPAAAARRPRHRGEPGSSPDPDHTPGPPGHHAGPPSPRPWP
jgi:drug/metabolite transporter (DMT)-like permease